MTDPGGDQDDRPGIRTARPADLARLRSLQRHLRAPNPPLLAYALTGEPTVLVAGDPPVGYLLLFLGEEAVVAELVVAPARRREGIGEALLETALDRASRGGAAAVVLAVRPDNEAARACYEASGFALAAERPDYYDEGTPALIMRRSI